ncbi:MAG: CDP-diacylglycerol--serine O-phosphatidyltransferase [Gammaproteobacteria bacterium]|nr:CDP-diacylglycerol--serine O-phosphatidyltransferase [Gammaproteobacteria bacterium]
MNSRKGIYLLPNLLTTGALFAGFYAIISAQMGRFEPACIAIFIAMVLDGLDGRVARMTNTSSEFGKEYDSLSDMVSFGLAPALIMFEWSLQHVVYDGWMLQRLGWLAAFFYTACAALRLARFNSMNSDLDRRYFQGLPSPAAAGLLVGFIWTCHDLGYRGGDLWLIALLTTLLGGGLMVSRFSFYSFKDLTVKNKVPTIAVLAVVGLFILAAMDPPKLMYAVFLLYALSAPLFQILRLYRKRRSRSQGAKAPKNNK